MLYAWLFAYTLAPFQTTEMIVDMLSYGIVDIWVYVLGAFAIIVMPGPNTLFVLKTGVVDGRKPAFAALSAVLLGDTVLMLCSYLGVAAAIAAHPGIFQWIRLAGGAYLAWLGAKVIYHVLTSERKARGFTARYLKLVQTCAFSRK